jgi:hypothetical protein
MAALSAPLDAQTITTADAPSYPESAAPTDTAATADRVETPAPSNPVHDETPVVADSPPPPPVVSPAAAPPRAATEPPIVSKGIGLPPLQFHAFASQGFIKSARNNYLAQSKRGSFEFTEVGLNATQVLTEKLRAGIQLFARQVGHTGDYRARVDWFYLDYRFADWLGIRAGRTKMPFGLYNEVNDIDAARVPVLLPQAVYPILNRDLLLALTGVELYGYLRLGPAGALEYRLYGGTLYVDPPVAPAGLTVTFEVPYVIGGRLLWEPPIDGLRVGGSMQALRFTTNYAVTGMMGMPPTPLFDLNIPFVLWLASAEYTGHDLILAAEYGRWRADLELTNTPTRSVENERFYALAAYRVTHWFTPGLYYSSLLPDVTKRSGAENYQHDLAMTLRFDVNPHWIIKVEGHLVRGTADLSTALNGYTPLAMLARDWAFVLVKTTVYF